MTGGWPALSPAFREGWGYRGQKVTNDAAGEFLWTVPGSYFPQIATADGGVIASTSAGTYVTFDQNGRATGQLASFPTQSWAGNAYTFGSPVVSIAAALVPTAYASYWPENDGNQSHNRRAIQLCPPIEQSKEALLETAYSDLTDYLLHSACPFCIANIFPQIKSSQGAFTSYLNRGHWFCDGMAATTVPAGMLGIAGSGTVADYFEANAPSPGLLTARTFTAEPSLFPPKIVGSLLFIFFAPQNIDNDNPFNKGLLFHEGLHGFTNLGDGGLIPGLCEALHVPSENQDCATHSIDISCWIEKNVFGTLSSKCPQGIF